MQITVIIIITKLIFVSENVLCPSFVFLFPWIIRIFPLHNPKWVQQQSYIVYYLMMVFHTVNKRIRLCKMEEVLSLSWLKCGQVPGRGLWWAGSGTQLGHVNELLPKHSRDGTAINVWVADQKLRIWKRNDQENLRIKIQMEVFFYSRYFVN